MRHDIKADYRVRQARGPALMRLAGTYAAALFLIVLAGTFALGAWNMYGRMARAGEGAAAAAAQLAKAELQQAQVAEDLERLKSQIGEEGELRRRYGMAKPGEGVIKIVAGTTTGDLQEKQESSEGPISRFLNAIFPW
jgi:cell division protein FtsB